MSYPQCQHPFDAFVPGLRIVTESKEDRKGTKHPRVTIYHHDWPLPPPDGFPYPPPPYPPPYEGAPP